MPGVTLERQVELMTKITVRKVIASIKAAFPPDSPAPFRIDARRACRTIAVLIFAAGFGAFCGGSLLVKVSATGKARYEGASGRFARALSPDDRDYYTYLGVTVVVARLLQLAGLAVGAYGVAALARPRHFELFLGDSGRNPGSQDASPITNDHLFPPITDHR